MNKNPELDDILFYLKQSILFRRWCSNRVLVTKMLHKKIIKYFVIHITQW